MCHVADPVGVEGHPLPVNRELGVAGRVEMMVITKVVRETAAWRWDTCTLLLVSLARSRGLRGVLSSFGGLDLFLSLFS